MAHSPIAFTAANYRDYKNYWLKAYFPGTTSPKTMATDSTLAVNILKAELNKDGFIVSSGGALITPWIDGAYDLWIFPTEAEADANDTSNALRLADNITGINGAVLAKSTVITFGSTTDAINEPNLEKIFDGSVLNIKDSAVWDVVLTISVTPNGVDIIQSIAIPTLSIVKRYNFTGDIFEDVTALKTHALPAGVLVETKGYYSGSTSGAAKYKIVTPQAADEFGDHTLANGNVAVLDVSVGANLSEFGLVGDGVVDDTIAMSAAINRNIKLVGNKADIYLLSNIVVADNLDIDFNGATIKTSDTLADLSTDIFSVQDVVTEVKVIKFKAQSCRAVFFLSQNYSGSIHLKDIELLQMASLIAGNGAEQDCGKLEIEHVKGSVIEQAVNLRNYGFIDTYINDVTCDDVRYRSISNRGSGSQPFGKYYTGGVLLQMGSGSIGKSVKLTNIHTSNVTRQDIDPFDSSPIVVTDRECHSAAASLDGLDTTLTISNCSGYKFTGTGQDVEPILGRADNVTMTGNSVLDTTADEGAIYTKGSTSATVTGNIVRFTTTPVDVNTQRGLIVTSPTVLVSGNIFENCGRAVSNRATKLLLTGNTFVTCLRTIANSFTANATETLIKNNYFDSCTLIFNDDSGVFETEVLSFTGNTFRLAAGNKIATFNTDNIRNIKFLANEMDGINLQGDRLISFQPNSSANSVNFTYIGNESNNTVGDGVTNQIIYFSGNCTNSNVTIQGNQVNDGNIGFRVRDETFNNLVVRNNIGYNLSSSLVNSNAGTLANNVLDLTGNLQ